MRKTLLSIGLMLAGITCINAQSPWLMQYTGFTRVGNYPFAMSVVDANTLWAGAFTGDGTNQSTQEYTHTTDGGTTWGAGIVTTDTNYRFSSIAGTDGNTAYAMMYNNSLGAGGGIWKTTDGGTTWNQLGVGLIFDALSFPDVIHFYDANNGVAIGDPNGGYYEIYTTTDAGATWTRTQTASIPLPLTNEYAIVNDFCVNDSTIWFGTNKGRVYKSTDKGLTWTAAVAATTAKTISDLAFIDANNGLAYSTTTTLFNVVKTTDGGASWLPITYTGNIYKSEIVAVPGTNVYMTCGASGTGGLTRGSSYSQTDGASWILVDSVGLGGSADGYTSLAFFNSQIGWAGAFAADPLTDGMYKWNANPVGVQQIDSKPIAGFNAYPNPANDFVTIELKNKNNGEVAVEVSNIAGAVVLTKVYSNTGVMFNQKLDVSSLENGAYFVKVSANGETSMQKLIKN